MKRIIVIMLIAVMSASLFVACGKKETEKPALTGDLTQIMDKIYENKKVELPLQTVPVDLNDELALSSYTGLTDASQIKEAVASESMIGSQAYSVILVRAKDSANTKNIADAMIKGINPAKWVCVEADDIKVATYDDVILYVMLSSALSDTVTANELIEAFKTVCGGTIDVIK